MSLLTKVDVQTLDYYGVDGPAVFLAPAGIDTAGLDYYGVDGLVYGPRGEYRLWSDSEAPADSTDTNPVNVGVRFKSSRAGSIVGIKFYRHVGGSGNHIGALWAQDGTKLGETDPLAIGSGDAAGWYEVLFPEPVPIEAETLYRASVLFPNGRYAATLDYFQVAAHAVDPLTAPADGATADTRNGVFVYNAAVAVPVNTFGSANYWVDPLFVDAAEATPTAVRPILFISM